MNENSILSFIGEYINAGLREILSGGTVERIFLDEETMKLDISARFDRYVEDIYIINAQNEIKNAIGINKVAITPYFHSSAFSDKCIPQFVRVVKENIAAANGFLENAKFTLNENIITISVFNGADILVEAGTKEFLSKYIKEHFDVVCTVEIKGENTAKIDSPEYLQMQAATVKI